MRRLQQLLLFMCLALLPTQGWAATAHVQDGSTRDSSGGSASTVAVTLTGVTSGNSIACGIAWTDQTKTLSSVSDGTNTYTLNNNNTNAGGVNRAAMAYMASSISGSVTITATFSAAFAEMKLISCHEVSGTDTAAVLDASSMTDIGAVGGGTDNITQAITTVTSGTYIFGFILNYGQNGAVTAGTNYTLGEQFASNNGASIYRANFGSTGSTNVLATDGSFDTHLVGAMAFKAGSAAAASHNLMLLGVGQ